VVTARDLIADRSLWLQDPKEAYSRFVWGWLFDRCEAIICADQEMKKKIADLFLIAEENLNVLRPRMFSLNARHNGRCRNTKEKTVLFAGSPDHSDGLEQFLRACARLQEERKTRMRLCLYGPDSRGRSPATRGLIRRSGLAEQIMFLKPEADAGWWVGVLTVIDLMVLSEPVEFIGNVVLGALSSGVPVMAVPCPAVRSLLGELSEEIICLPGHEERMAALMEAMLFDDQLRGRLVAELGRLSREWQPMGPALLSLYRQVCDHRRSADRKGGETDAVRNTQLGGGGDLREC
jgi:glycosyltransferase involved in cell wall biosynthesis